ncbi:MAG: zf-HC2 domain-containing protein [Pirellulales bacterium]|nr:zf-HC2 domain-containing protein [Pirellulales bacterium]
MRCREAQSKLDRFVAQELTSAERAQVGAHLASCAACRRALASLRWLQEILADAPAPPIPGGFADRIVARARTQQAATARSNRASRFEQSAWKTIHFSAARAAALAAGLLLGLLMGRDTWRASAGPQAVAAAQQTDLLAAAGLEPLVESGGDSLAHSYIRLTLVGER